MYHTLDTVAWMSLLIQNTLLALCAVVLALMFILDWDVCHNVVVFSCLTVVIVLLAAGGSLATVANTISIEKDWVVVLADKNKETLAGEGSEVTSGTQLIQGVTFRMGSIGGSVQMVTGGRVAKEFDC